MSMSSSPTGAYRASLGREMPRRKYVCDSCQVRRAVGQPDTNGVWPQRMRSRMDQLDVDNLTAAAAEYRDLCAQTGVPESVVDFVDWIAPEITGLAVQQLP